MWVDSFTTESFKLILSVVNCITKIEQTESVATYRYNNAINIYTTGIRFIPAIYSIYFDIHSYILSFFLSPFAKIFPVVFQNARFSILRICAISQGILDAQRGCPQLEVTTARRNSTDSTSKQKTILRNKSCISEYMRSI